MPGFYKVAMLPGHAWLAQNMTSKYEYNRSSQVVLCIVH